MKVNCLSCGHNVDLDDVYEDYEGPVKCFACGATLEIKCEQGHLRRVQFARRTAYPHKKETIEHAP